MTAKMLINPNLQDLAQGAVADALHSRLRKAADAAMGRPELDEILNAAVDEMVATLLKPSPKHGAHFDLRVDPTPMARDIMNASLEESRPQC